MESWKVIRFLIFEVPKHLIALKNEFICKLLCAIMYFSRNPDIHEAVLEDDQGKPVLKFSIATGFRNIQTLVRKMNPKTSLPHYVEIMACPTGNHTHLLTFQKLECYNFISE